MKKLKFPLIVPCIFFHFFSSTADNPVGTEIIFSALSHPQVTESENHLLFAIDNGKLSLPTPLHSNNFQYGTTIDVLRVVNFHKMLVYFTRMEKKAIPKNSPLIWIDKKSIKLHQGEPVVYEDDRSLYYFNRATTRFFLEKQKDINEIFNHKEIEEQTLPHAIDPIKHVAGILCMKRKGKKSEVLLDCSHKNIHLLTALYNSQTEDSDPLEQALNKLHKMGIDRKKIHHALYASPTQASLGCCYKNIDIQIFPVLCTVKPSPLSSMRWVSINNPEIRGSELSRKFFDTHTQTLKNMTKIKEN